MNKKAALISTLVILAGLLAALSILLQGGVLPPAEEDAPMPSPGVTAGPAPTPTPEPTAAPAPTPTPAPTPEPTPTPTPAPVSYTLSFVGDCTIASSQHHKGASFAYESVVGNDYAFPFAETLTYFAEDYMSIGNLESVFTTAEENNGATFVFKADPVYAHVLSEGSIEAVVLGNNHGYDFLAQGQEDTRAALDAVGVAYAGENDFVIFQREDGLKVGLYSKLYPTVADVESGIAAVKAAGAELIVAGLHWGLEGSYQVTPDQQKVGHAAIDAGAHIVYGSHPHVLQRTEAYNGGHIFYSLGNWSFGGHTNPRDRDTAIIRITVERAHDGSLTVGEPEFVPCSLSSAAGYNNYQPIPYAPESEEYARTMRKLDGSFDGADLEIDYSAFHKDESSGGTS